MENKRKNPHFSIKKKEQMWSIAPSWIKQHWQTQNDVLFWCFVFMFKNKKSNNKETMFQMQEIRHFI